MLKFNYLLKFSESEFTNSKKFDPLYSTKLHLNWWAQLGMYSSVILKLTLEFDIYLMVFIGWSGGFGSCSASDVFT